METRDKNRLESRKRYQCIPYETVDEEDLLAFLLYRRRASECIQELIDHGLDVDSFFQILVRETMEDIGACKISAEEVAERLSFWFLDRKGLFYKAVKALEAVGAPPWITAYMKYHPKLHVLATIDYYWYILAHFYTWEPESVPKNILFGFQLKYWPFSADDILDGFKRLEKKPSIDPIDVEHAMRSQFCKIRPAVFAPGVLDGPTYLRDFYVFMLLFIANVYELSGELYKVLRSGGEERGKFILRNESKILGHSIEVETRPCLVGHGKVRDKYWIFFQMR